MSHSLRLSDPVKGWKKGKEEHNEKAETSGVSHKHTNEEKVLFQRIWSRNLSVHCLFFAADLPSSGLNYPNALHSPTATIWSSSKRPKEPIVENIHKFSQEAKTYRNKITQDNHTKQKITSFNNFVEVAIQFFFLKTIYEILI